MKTPSKAGNDNVFPVVAVEVRDQRGGKDGGSDFCVPPDGQILRAALDVLSVPVLGRSGEGDLM